MNTTGLGQSDTPRCDEAEKWTNDAGRMVSLKFAEGLERELSQLRANLERLVARWDSIDGWSQAPGATHEMAKVVRRVLAGETPPEPGQDWPAVPAPTMDLAALDVHAGGPIPMFAGSGEFKREFFPWHGEGTRPTTSGEFDALATGPQSRRDVSAGGPQG